MAEGPPIPSLKLDAVLDMAAAGPLIASLNERRGGDLALDAAAVERLSGPCLQVLLSAAKTWAANGARLSLHHPTEPLLQTLRLTGADSLQVLLAQESPQ